MRGRRFRAYQHIIYTRTPLRPAAPNMYHVRSCIPGDALELYADYDDRASDFHIAYRKVLWYIPLLASLTLGPREARRNAVEGRHTPSAVALSQACSPG